MADLLDFPALFAGQNKTGATIQRPVQKMNSILMSPPVLIRGGLDIYIGEWNEFTAKHLLQRAMFSPNAAQIAEAVADGMLN